MPTQEVPDRIAIDPLVCFGRPAVRGTRVWVRVVLDLLAGGMTADEILHEYPSLTLDDIQGCLAYGASLSRSRHVAGR